MPAVSRVLASRERGPGNGMLGPPKGKTMERRGREMQSSQWTDGREYASVRREECPLGGRLGWAVCGATSRRLGRRGMSDCAYVGGCGDIGEHTSIQQHRGLGRAARNSANSERFARVEHIKHYCRPARRMWEKKRPCCRWTCPADDPRRDLQTARDRCWMCHLWKPTLRLSWPP